MQSRDITLRDGTQEEDISFCVEDQIKIRQQSDSPGTDGATDAHLGEPGNISGHVSDIADVLRLRYGIAAGEARW